MAWEDTSWEDNKCSNRMMALQQNGRNTGRGRMEDHDDHPTMVDASDAVTEDATDTTGEVTGQMCVI